jgi:serine-type D-Ala-D-Ala carboxypeptidase/endopeptidase (penicillin-binding protein 4)
VRRTTIGAALVAALCVSCAGAPGRASLASALAELEASPALAGGRVGVHVVDLADGAVLASSMADRGFAPASNQKVLTSLVALATLGSEHRFTTELWAVGEVAGGELRGDLRLVGKGDPTLAAGRPFPPPWQDLVQALRAAGIERVAGSLFGDGSWLGDETLGHGWQWDYLDEDYAAPFSGLNVARNLVTIRVRPGEPAGVVVTPPGVHAEEVTVVVESAPAGAQASVAARRELGSDRIVVRGRVPADAAATLRVPVRDPATFAAGVAAAELAALGVPVLGREIAAVGEPRLVATFASPTVGAIVAPLLTDSDNLYAEVLFRAAAKVATGRTGTAAAAAHASTVLEGLGVPVAGLVMADGSGLSRRDLVQPRQLTAALAAAWRAPWRSTFVAGLPVGGESGTLRSRFAAGPARGRVRAKTGFISRVVCLSGFVPRPDPRQPPIAFSVMLNDFVCDAADAKAAVDRFVQRLCTVAGW